jgi:hypothetical protein
MIPERIAMIYHPLPSCLGYGDYLERGFQAVCHTQHFLPGEETEGFDHYYYVDDGPTYYMEPKFRPATYFAMDMVVKPFWYLDPVEHYFERCLNFDRVMVTSTATLRYCKERGMEARMIGFAADPEHHRPHPVTREYDWIALWHNTGDRVAVCEAAAERYPGGRVLWAGYDTYAEYISRGKCALNWLRGDIVNMRVFEVMACGTPLITTRHEDMDYYRFVEGQHYLGFTGLDEMLDKIGYVLAHPGETEAMARRAMEFVLAKHTYYNRALEVIG